MKNIWIFHHYASAPNEGALVRPYDFCKQLIKKGYNPKIFASGFNHYTHKMKQINNGHYIESDEDGIPFIFTKDNSYGNNGLDRIKNMFSFYFNLFKVTKQISKKTGEKPDIIIASSPHPLTCIAGLFIAKRYKIPCVVEIRDLWPESIVEYSNSLTKKNLFIKLLYQGEKWIYMKADKLFFTMPGGADYIKERGWDKKIDMSKVYHLNNGVDLELFDYNKENFKIQDEDLDNENLFKVVYTGSVRKANNLGILLDAAKKITNPNVKFLIWGGGNEVHQLSQRIKDEKINNVVIKGPVEKKYVPYILSKADANLCHNTGSELFRFGISFNKLFDYYASGKPMIMDFKTNYSPINLYKCGVSCEKNQLDFAVNQILEISPLERKNMCDNARKTAIEFDFKVLTDKLIKILEV